MDTRSVIKSGLDQYITDSYPDTDGRKSYLLNHERKSRCIDNLTKEINMACLKVPKLIANKDTLKIVMDSFFSMFCETCLKHKEQSLETDLQKHFKQKALSDAREIISMADEIINDKTVTLGADG